MGEGVNVIGIIEGYSVEGRALEVSLAGRDGSRVTLGIPVELLTYAHGKPWGRGLLAGV
jgi:hypothetical protein